MKEIKIGLIGFGTVGTGMVQVLQENASLIEQRLGGRIRLQRIADIDLERERGVQVPPEILTSEAEAVLSDPEIAICVELVGGIEPVHLLNLDLPELYAYLMDMLERLQPGHYVLANSDSCPPGVTVDKFQLVTQIVCEHC